MFIYFKHFLVQSQVVVAYSSQYQQFGFDVFHGGRGESEGLGVVGGASQDVNRMAIDEFLKEFILMLEFIGGGVSFGVMGEVVPFSFGGLLVADFLSVIFSRNMAE